LLFKEDASQDLDHYDALRGALVRHKQLVPDLTQYLEQVFGVLLEEVGEDGLVDEGLEEDLFAAADGVDVLQEALHDDHPLIDDVQIGHLVEGFQHSQRVPNVRPGLLIKEVVEVAGNVGLHLVHDAGQDDLLDLLRLEVCPLRQL